MLRRLNKEHSQAVKRGKNGIWLYILEQLSGEGFANVDWVAFPSNSEERHEVISTLDRLQGTGHPDGPGEEMNEDFALSFWKNSNM